MKLDKISQLSRPKHNILDKFSPLDLTTSPILQKHIDECANCSEVVEQILLPDGQIYYAATSCKHHLVCPICATRRMYRYASHVQNCITSSPTPLHHAFMTLTLKNDSNLEIMLDTLKLCFGKLVKLLSSDSIKGIIDPSLAYSYEIKRSSRSFLWHPHIHALISSPFEINFEHARDDILTRWYDLTKTSYITDIKPLYGNIISSIFEVVSYAVKFSSLDAFDIYTLYPLCHRKRLYGATGIYRHTHPKQPLPAGCTRQITHIISTGESFPTTGYYHPNPILAATHDAIRDGTLGKLHLWRKD